jgi:hypothetical protein
MIMTHEIKVMFGDEMGKCLADGNHQRHMLEHGNFNVLDGKSTLSYIIHAIIY